MLKIITGKHPAGLLIENSRLHLVISLEFIGLKSQLLSYFSLHITL